MLFDANVLLDIATADPIWSAWSELQFRIAVARGPILINPIIYAELAPAFSTPADLDRWLDPAFFLRLPLPYAAGWLAAEAFHAEIEKLILVTRDASRYRTYFPAVTLVTPP